MNKEQMEQRMRELLEVDSFEGVVLEVNQAREFGALITVNIPGREPMPVQPNSEITDLFQKLSTIVMDNNTEEELGLWEH